MSTADADLRAWVERHRGASFRAFAVWFRTRTGYPMTAGEWLVAEMAHSQGWHDGLDAALRSAEDEAVMSKGDGDV